MFLVYNVLLALLSPIWVPWMLWRTRKRAEAPHWAERFGRMPIPFDREARRVWLHAVSVGEVMAAVPVLRELRTALPDYEIVLSVTTSSGHQTAREQAAGLIDHLVYLPIDLTRYQFRAMAQVRPKVVAIMETELWMNLLWASKVVGARTMLVNGRISDRSFPRARRLRAFYRALLARMDRCLMQTDTDVERILVLGAKSAERLGNTKFDQAAEGLDADPQAWHRALGLPEGRPVVVVGSTRDEDEEKLVVEAIAQVGLDRISVVHAPRHLERAAALAESVRQAFGCAALRSEHQGGLYVILDTYGELSKVYSVAAIVVVGGGFADHGGQNLLQPLAHGKPVLHGPHMQNFSEVADAARAAGATRTCATADELASAIRELLDRPEMVADMGRAAKLLVMDNLGASRRYAQAIAHEAAIAVGKT